MRYRPQLVTPEVESMHREVNAAIADMRKKQLALLEDAARRLVAGGASPEDIERITVDGCQCECVFSKRDGTGFWVWWNHDDEAQTFTLLSGWHDRCVHMNAPVKMQPRTITYTEEDLQ